MRKLKEITEVEFWEIVEDVIIPGINKLRIFYLDYKPLFC